MKIKVTMPGRSSLLRREQERKGKHLQQRKVVEEEKAKKGGKEKREENEKPKKKRIGTSGRGTGRVVRGGKGKTDPEVLLGRGRDQIRRVPWVLRLR